MSETPMPNNDTMSNAKHTPEVIKARKRERNRQALLAAAMPAPSDSAVLVPVETLKVATRALRNAERANLPECEREVIFRAIALLAALGGES